MVGEGGGLPCPFLKIKVPWFWKKGPGFVHPSVKFTIQNVVLKVSREKTQKFPVQGFFSLNFWGNVYRSALISWYLPCPENFLVLHLIYDISNLIFVHWNCIDSICRNRGGLVVWYLKRWPGFDSQPGLILSAVNYLQLMIHFKKNS